MQTHNMERRQWLCADYHRDLVLIPPIFADAGIVYKSVPAVTTESSIIQELVLRVHNLLQEMKYSSSFVSSTPSSSQGRPSTNIPRFIKWEFPPTGFIKVNTDGSYSSGTNKAGGGGLLRSDQGQWIRGFSCFFGTSCSIVGAELSAIRHGLILAWNLGYKHVQLNTDSQIACNLIGGEDNEALPCREIITDCKKLLARDWHCSVTHALRESNNCADFLAKLGRSTQEESYHEWTDPPPGMSELLRADVLGVTTPRV